MRYEYACNGSDCGKQDVRVEIEKPLADLDRPEYCDKCKRPMRRVPALSSFQLKGGGWARDLYAGKGSK